MNSKPHQTLVFVEFLQKYNIKPKKTRDRGKNVQKVPNSRFLTQNRHFFSFLCLVEAFWGIIKRKKNIII